MIQFYSIHGISFRLETHHPGIIDSLSPCLDYFKAGHSDNPDILFSLKEVPGGDDAATMEHISKNPGDYDLLYRPGKKDHLDMSGSGLKGLRVYRSMHGPVFYFDLRDIAFISYDIKEGRAWGYIHYTGTPKDFALTGYLVMVVLMQLLKTKGYFFSHCSVVDLEGKGVMIPGFSGAGKTTTGVALVRAGFSLLGDDGNFLAYQVPGQVEILSFPERINVTEETLDFFPEIKNHGRVTKNAHNRKPYGFHIEDIFPGAIKDRTVPRAILFPEITPAVESHLVSLPKFEAIRRILPHSLLAYDKDSTRNHFNLICDLVEHTESYTLKLGRDVEHLPRLVTSVL